jgi:hypothetical protein
VELAKAGYPGPKQVKQDIHDWKKGLFKGKFDFVDDTWPTFALVTELKRVRDWKGGRDELLSWLKDKDEETIDQLLTIADDADAFWTVVATTRRRSMKFDTLVSKVFYGATTNPGNIAAAKLTTVARTLEGSDLTDKNTLTRAVLAEVMATLK